MYRKDSIIIEEWLKRSDKALLVTGARQIGKTWLIREEIAKSGFLLHTFTYSANLSGILFNLLDCFGIIILYQHTKNGRQSYYM